MEQLLDYKREGHSRILSTLFYAFWVLNKKLLSQNNVEYDKPLCCSFMAGAWEGMGGGGGGGGCQVKH